MPGITAAYRINTDNSVVSPVSAPEPGQPGQRPGWRVLGPVWKKNTGSPVTLLGIHTREYYYVQQGVLLCTAGSPIMYTRESYYVHQGVLLCTAGSTIVYSREYYYVQQGVLLCTAGSTIMYSREYYYVQLPDVHVHAVAILERTRL